MKQFYFLLITILFSSFSFGQTLLNENFDYGATPGDLTTITTNWTGFSGTGPIGYISTSLSMTDYPSSGIGGSVTIDDVSEDAERSFTAVTSGVVYASALFNASSVSSGANGTYFFTLRQGSGYHSLIYTKTDGSGGMVFGVRETTSDSAGTIFGSTSFALNTTYLLVLKYDFTAGATSLYVLPAISLTEPVTAEVSTNSGTDATSLGGVAFRQATGGPNATIDGIRVGTSWAGIMVASELVLGEVTTTCNSRGSGDTDDTYNATIDFIGGLNGNDFVLTTNAGTIGGDSPTSSSTGTITISNIPEGTDITFTASDTADGGTTSKTKNIDSPACIPLVMNEIFYDVTGGDVGDANGDGLRDAGDDEFIEFVNTSGAPLDISGYKIYVTNAEPRHVFPSGSIIPANGYLVVFGDVTPTGSFGGAIVQVASTNALGLINSGVIINVTNSNDDVIETYDYTSFGSNPDQSITRNPKATGDFVLHSSVVGGNPYFSPGLDADKITIWTGAVDTDWDTAGNWDNGVSTSSMSAIIKDVASYPIAAGAVNVAYLDIKANASVTINGAVTNSNPITLYSGATLIAQTSVSGSVTYKRNLPTTDSWYLVSSPVAGETIEDLIANHTFATGTPPNIGFSTFNNTGAAWTYATDALTGSVMNGKGYSVRLASPGDISFTGTANTSDVTFPLTQGTNNYNLVGNPFTSFINSTTFLTNEAANVELTFWMWNGTSYDTRTTGTSPNFKIAPGQAFFVEAKTTNNVTFTEALQSHEAADTFQKSTNTSPEVKLLVSEGSQSRKLEVFYIEGTTKGFDNGFDGKMFGGVTDNFSIFSELVSENVGVKYAIQSLPNSDLETMIVPVGIKAAAGKEITFTADAMNLPGDTKVFLEDRLTNIITRLDEANSSYKVTLNDALNGTGRFFLHTKASGVLSTDEVALQNTSIYAINNSTLRVVGLPSGNANVKMYTILGKQVMQTSFSSTGVKDISLPKLATGMYIIQLETATGKLNKKIVLE
ncbi:lamin tail domain-containing protein [Polaribacter sp. BAL334]|uniref:lamin tail domain-containing protein n=1 Tax=Polaribacter sp. BAL334 TaxID=1708178 RepID=UPI0018D244FA|nr:lamin tail domain-containing protein [Polaribacter sp. BAL334]MBG7611526.1 lamin tail domain-containing protein [Polaribacter sp. BAL334]